MEGSVVVLYIALIEFWELWELFAEKFSFLLVVLWLSNSYCSFNLGVEFLGYSPSFPVLRSYIADYMII